MNRSAFTLIELVIVILIVGILGAVAAPHVINSSEDAMIQATLRDIDAIFDAAEFHMAQHGAYPSNTDASNAPGDFDGYLPERVFMKRPPIGGASYSWVASGSGLQGTGEGVVVITVGNQELSTSLLTAIDEIYDDGDLTTGAAQIISGGKQFALAIDYEPPKDDGSGDLPAKDGSTSRTITKVR